MGCQGITVLVFKEPLVYLKLEKTLMLRKIKVKRRKRATEGEMVGWH